ncbi:hypothetical protein WDU94_010117 [Cyamophila willieti]
MYSSQMIRKSAAGVSKPSWQSRKNVNKQKSSDRFMISKKKCERNSNSFAKKRKEFSSDRDNRDMAESPGKKVHPAKQIRKGHCLTFKKNRHSDEELLAIHKSLDSTDNKTVITIATSDNKPKFSPAENIATQGKLRISSSEKNGEFGSIQEIQSSRVHRSDGYSELVTRTSRSSEEEENGRCQQDQQGTTQEDRCCATGVSTGNATGATSRSNSTGDSSSTSSTTCRSSHHTGNISCTSGSNSTQFNSTPSSLSSNPLSALDQTSVVTTNLTKELCENIPSRPTSLPLGNHHLPSNLLPPSHERTVIGRELTPPRKESSESQSESSSSPSPSSLSSSSRRNNKKPPPSKNSPLHIESNVREEADGSEDPQDPEIEELSRLRCPSDSTEVIAERENRRRLRQRRCADYPGLAFGSSVFSSDTMMKFNIIKNELQNIMNSSLKRVRTMHELS